MAEENKHPPTTEEQAPPEMPGKAPKMEQAEIPDVGGGPAPSAKVIDLSADAFHAGKGRSAGHPQGDGGPVRFRHRVQQAGMGKAHAGAGAGEAQAQTGPPCKSRKSHAHRAGGQERGKSGKVHAVAVRPRQKKRPRSRPSRPRLARPTQPPRKRQHPRPRKCRLHPATLPAPKKRKSSILTFPTCTRSRIILSVSVTMRK